VFTAEDVEDMSNGEIERFKISAFPGVDPDDLDDSELVGLSFGMGWFPGYSIDVETGERLAMAFGEDSWLADENGRDMIFNPSAQLTNEFGGGAFFNPNNIRMGGMHYVYTFRNFRRQDTRDERMTHYDGANYMYHNLREGATERKRVFRSCTWIVLPILRSEDPEFAFKSVEDGLIPTETKVKIRVAKPYARMATVAGLQDLYPYQDASIPSLENFDYFFWDEASGVVDPEEFDPAMFPLADGPAIDQSINDWFPTYSFSTVGLGADLGSTSALASALEECPANVVPNPYYGGSDYENSRLSNIVKVVNLPYRANIKIYNTSGTLIRNIVKDDESTEYVWDLKNERNVPISGGVYIFHIEIPGVTEKVIKWFGALRPIDLDNF
jgi:hypothetical protein